MNERTIHDEAHGFTLELHRCTISSIFFVTEYSRYRPLEIITNKNRDLVKDDIALRITYSCDLSGNRISRKSRTPGFESRMVNGEPIGVRLYSLADDIGASFFADLFDGVDKLS